jgi:uncharacterized ferritin-like protein (DUF455 family)
MTNSLSYNFNYNNSTTGAPLAAPALALPVELRSAALQALCCTDLELKVAAALYLNAQAATLFIANGVIPIANTIPGRPERPVLMAQLNIPKRSPYTPDGLAALVHAVCHIEFNAINLALDAVLRFAGMPREYYVDWARVAAEEAYHFSLLSAHLQSMGYQYGDYPAHNGLWEMTEKTAGNITARMALVPRTLEARGLDATPLMQAKLRKVGSPDAMKTVEILDIILRDEIGHVAIGNHWYRWLCTRDGLEPVAHFKQLIKQYEAPRMKPPFNEAARRKAGFTDAEMRALLEN